MKTFEVPTLKAKVPESAVTRKHLEAFRDATGSTYATQFPPTFYTVFRRAEYEIMDQIDTQWQYLLHSEQEYEYFGVPKEGHVPEVKSRLAELRERKTGGFFMRFIKLESEISVEGKKMAVVRTSFVIRQPLENQ